MKKSNPNGGVFLEKWEIETARYWALRFKSEREDNQEDLFQEGLIKWVEVRNTYRNPDLASRRTYMSRVLRNHLINLKNKSKVIKREAIYKSISMDDSHYEDQGTLHNFIGKHDRSLSNSDLRLDVTKALQKLSPLHLQLCRLIIDQQLSSSEIASILKLHKSTVCREKVSIRKIFENEGLKNYLKNI